MSVHPTAGSFPPDFWFADLALEPAVCVGPTLYAVDSRGVWTTSRRGLTFEGLDDPLVREAAELTSFYGGAVGGMGHSLGDVGVPLPEFLRKWSYERDRPAAELGEWLPALVSIDGVAQLAVRMTLDDQLTVFMTTWRDQHIGAMVPVPDARAVALISVQTESWRLTAGGAERRA